MKSIILTVLGMILVIVLAIVAYSEAEKAIRLAAIDGCLQAGRITMQKDGQTVTISENYWYNDCMSRKGLSK
jgi:hypothetical protein